MVTVRAAVQQREECHRGTEEMTENHFSFQSLSDVVFFLSHVRLKVQSWVVVLDIGYKRAFTVHVIHRCCTPGESNVTNI